MNIEEITQDELSLYLGFCETYELIGMLMTYLQDLQISFQEDSAPQDEYTLKQEVYLNLIKLVSTELKKRGYVVQLEELEL